MKKLLLALVFFGFVVNAQTKEKPELNCFDKWNQKFNERGAAPVEDGTYTDVIISIRSNDKAECFEGKAVVAFGKIKSFYIVREDGTFEEVKRNWKTKMEDIPVTNGMSRGMVTENNDIYYVLFIKKILPKKAAFKKAPEPKDD